MRIEVLYDAGDGEVSRDLFEGLAVASPNIKVGPDGAPILLEIRKGSRTVAYPFHRLVRWEATDDAAE